MAHAANARTRRLAPRRRTRGGIRWDRVGRVGLLAVLGAILLLYVSPIKHWIEQSSTAGEQSRELSGLTKENRHLKRRVRELRSSGALEREARRLGMVRRDERSFVIENLKSSP
jgi:cell division protein FtsB